jgi:hypothetical protein
MKMIKKNGIWLWKVALGYLHFAFSGAIIVLLAGATAWILDFDWEMMCLVFGLVWSFVETREARKDCSEAVRRVDALKDILILTYSTIRTVKHGDKEFECIVTQGQAFREKATEGNSK